MKSMETEDGHRKLMGNDAVFAQFYNASMMRMKRKRKRQERRLNRMSGKAEQETVMRHFQSGFWGQEMLAPNQWAGINFPIT